MKNFLPYLLILFLFKFTGLEAQTTATPVVITPSNGSIINTTTPSYSGTAAANSTVTLYVDNAVGTTTATNVGTWSINAIVLSQGTHTVMATAQASGSAVSANSNTNTFTVDTFQPMVSISSSTAASGSSSSSTTFAFTVTFSENVTGFVAGDIMVTNGTKSGFNGSGTTYTFNVTPASYGVVTVNVPANVAQDAGGNLNIAATQYSITYSLSPTITSFTPISAKPGDAVTITGTNFNTTAANNIVFFGATKATVTAATATSLTVTVTAGATYAPITVLNTGTNLAAYSLANFNPIYSPAKTNITTVDFTPKIDFGTGSRQYSVVIGDLDGDGKPDLVVANYSLNTVSVFRNISTSGSITSSSFAAKVDFATGYSPNSLAIGDLDGDGKLDLAVSNYSSNSVSILRNTSTIGSASFATKVDFSTVSNTYSVAIGDLDGDGKLDFAVPNVTSNSVSIFRNISTSGSIGIGSFETNVDFTTGNAPVSVAIGDLDGDGKPDMVVANQSSDNVSTFRNISTKGSIGLGSFAPKVDFTTGSNPVSVAIGDLDGDGKPDLAVANGFSNNVSIFRNTSINGSIGSGSFATKIDFIAGTNPVFVAIGDLNGDGKPDLAVANQSSNNVSTLLNTSSSGSIGSGSFATRVNFNTAFSSYPKSVAIGDLDGDGKPDLAVANSGSNSFSLFRNADIVDLSSLTISAGTLAPSFAIGTITYTANVANSVSTITVTPTAVNTEATITVNAVTVVSGSASGNISLNVGSNTITTLVTALDGSTKTYTVTVTRAAASANADLSALALSAGTLSPTFAAATTGYTASVSNTTTSITVTPTVADATATVKVNGTTVASAAASGALALNVGSNTITTIVTAQDGTTTKTYTVTVTRAASANADLSALALSAGTLSPTFAAATTGYTASVSNATTSITITPTVSDATATVKVNGTTVASASASGTIALNVGSNSITTIVTAQDGTTTKTYTVTVTRAASANANLSALRITPGALTPPFDAATISYTASVPATTTSVTVTPTVADINSTVQVRVNGGTYTTVTSGSDSSPLPLNLGANPIDVKVTAQDGTTIKTYTITVTRENPLPVSFISFDVKLNNAGSVDLIWLTASEKNNSHFIVLKSTDGVNFSELTKISGSGNSDQQNRYQTADKNPANGNNYYQLVQYDFDGKATVLATKVVNVSLAVTTEVSVYPNPVKDIINVEFESGQFSSLKLIDMKGSVLMIKAIDSKQSQISLENLNLPTATYIIRLEGKAGVVSKTIVKQ